MFYMNLKGYGFLFMWIGILLLVNFNSKEEIPARTYIRAWYMGDPERYGEDTGTEAVGAVRQLVQGQQPPSWLPLIRRCLAILGNTW